MKIKRIFIIFILFFLFIINFSIKTYAATTNSLGADFINKVFAITLTDGTDIYDTNNTTRRTLNTNILKNTSKSVSSLYDRFGGNLVFVPYFGEKKFSLNLVDTFYDNIKDNNGKFQFKIQDLWANTDGQINNIVYTGRPDILSEQVISAGKVDPRRAIYSAVSVSGGEANVGNLYLGISKFITSTVGYLSGSGIYKAVNTAWNSIINTKVYKGITDQIMVFFPLLVCMFVVCLFYMTIKIIKGEKSLNQHIIEIANFFFALGIVFMFLTNPNAFQSVTNFAVTSTDTIFKIGLSSTANEVSKSDDPTNIVQATLWSKTVLDPWCRGMFNGRSYDQLYTQFNNSATNTKLPQSKTSIIKPWTDKSIKYNSATLTGDIQIPLGNKKVSRNWAALAWSTQSLYHIDAVKDATNSKLIDGYSWPVAKRTPLNSNIYADDFRWLDAKLNISPGYSTPTANDSNYKLSNSYSESFISSGIDSLFMSLLLLPILYPIIRRLVSLIQIVTLGLRWLIRSLGTISKPGDGRYSVISNLKAVFISLYEYFWWSLSMYMMISIYMAITGSIIGDIVWLPLSIIICKFKPVTTSNQVNNIKKFISKGIGNIKYKISNKIAKIRLKK